jgi:hypothetical protein
VCYEESGSRLRLGLGRDNSRGMIVSTTSTAPPQMGQRLGAALPAAGVGGGAGFAPSRARHIAARSRRPRLAIQP